MRTNWLLLLLLAGLVAGCATRYNVTLTSGRTISAKGKPRFDKTRNSFVFKDATGQQVVMPAMRIREIAPASMSSQNIPTSVNLKP
jgi:hypothetical protein